MNNPNNYVPGYYPLTATKKTEPHSSSTIPMYYIPSTYSSSDQLNQNYYNNQHYHVHSQPKLPTYVSGESEDVDQKRKKILQNIINLRNPQKREQVNFYYQALQQLSKKKDAFENLAPLLWHTVGTIAILLQQIVQIYPDLSPPRLTSQASNRVCSVLGLFQSLSLHSAIRPQFIKAHIPLFLYPFLNTTNKQKNFENVRVTSLGVIGALVKGDDTQAIAFLMQTEIIPLCLRIMKRGQDLSRTVATFIVQKILNDANGLKYICHTGERFYAVSTVLSAMVQDLANSEKEDFRLLRHIMKCYQRLAQSTKTHQSLLKCLPQSMKDPPSLIFLKDQNVKKSYNTVMKTLYGTKQKQN